MGNMNLGQMQAAVLRALDNLRSNHPMVVAGDHTRCINDAAADVIRLFPERFVEHHDRSWTTGPTAVSADLISLPNNLLVLQKVRHSDGATITAGDWSSIEEKVVSHVSVETIGLLNKVTTIADYPRLYDRKGTNLLYHPTTRTGFTTTFRFYGISRETPISAAGDTFRMDRDFDEVIVLLGAAKLARLIGYSDRAVELETAAKRRVGEGISVTLHEAGTHVIEPIWNFSGGREG